MSGHFPCFARKPRGNALYRMNWREHLICIRPEAPPGKREGIHRQNKRFSCSHPGNTSRSSSRRSGPTGTRGRSFFLPRFPECNRLLRGVDYRVDPPVRVHPLRVPPSHHQRTNRCFQKGLRHWMQPPLFRHSRLPEAQGRTARSCWELRRDRRRSGDGHIRIGNVSRKINREILCPLHQKLTHVPLSCND